MYVFEDLGVLLRYLTPTAKNTRSVSAASLSAHGKCQSVSPTSEVSEVRKV